MSPSAAGLMLETAPRLFASLDPGIVWSGALLAALAYALRSAPRHGLESRTMYWACVLAIVFGLWGGHLLGIVYYGTDGHPWAWLRFWSGGSAQYGGLMAGFTAVLLFLKIRKIPFLPYADAASPAVALGVAIGRIGCFLNGDDFGTVSHLPWAVQFPIGTEAYADHFARGWITSANALSLPVHPIQLYSSLLWFGFFAILALWCPNRSGLGFALFSILHGMGRFAEQFFRGDFQPVLGPLSLSQLISLLFIAVGLGVWLNQSRERSVDAAAVTKFAIQY